MSHEKTEDEEKKDWPVCVFFPDVKCHVRYELQSSTALSKMIEPLTKSDDHQVAIQVGRDVMRGVAQAMGMEWASLAAFCHVCPTLSSRRMEFPSLPKKETPK